ncbi:MAG: Dyp-type peroxidase [Actinomycetaceae bacterium]|nr:Dyp-type peroxidase [Actinomycetaceae bacterium]MDY6083495.1 Dyp-type peroxidase [Actinomycetaceae bacterium]
MAEETPLVDAKLPFDGSVQAGIMNPQSASMALLGFNLEEGVGADQLRTLMQTWTVLARHLTQGERIEDMEEYEMAEVPASLTITVGWGERIFTVLGAEDLIPEGLHDVPAFSLDHLNPAWGQTDLVLQISSDDPVTTSTAVRVMVRSALGVAKLFWRQNGYGHAFGAVPAGTTPRNPLGQIDGTVNPSTPEEWSEQVFIDSDEAWLKNSSIMVVRRIIMNLDAWEKLAVAQRSRVIGRDYHTGGPLSGGGEFDDEDMDAKDENGEYLIDRHSHLALAREQDGQPSDALRRRAYAFDDNFVDNPMLTSNSGLVWISFQKNPDKQFTPIQKRLDEADLLNDFVAHIGSGVFWILPGTTPTSYWGEALFEKLEA